ncbi:transcriptional regulator, AlpA family [Ruegeria halocynthiae]|uniref:Transcriptional regulator, AlpA family n=1 Tax=Ruegeria halocynthiae TaxID=985054 RepID=A0A1H2REI3_9RHOB|nr:AlpA family phage regulatory protein [Ruegeria halocynthiae]SDW17876.1 transcriptional regulator, AlpA family [Ruegeria halocynthiae]
MLAHKKYLSKKYLSGTQTLEVCPISKSTRDRLIKDGRWPKPIKIGSRSFWLADEVDTAMQAFADARED